MEKEKIYKPCKHEKSCREGNILICSDCPHGIYDLEKGIDIIENFIENHLERDKLEINEGRGGFKIGQIYKITELNPALSHLLIEYKNLKQENKELKKLKYVYGIDMDFDYIPKNKIREKIKDIKEDKESKYYYKFLEYRDIEITIQILKELLEEELKDEKSL